MAQRQSFLEWQEAWARLGEGTTGTMFRPIFLSATNYTDFFLGNWNWLVWNFLSFENDHNNNLRETMGTKKVLMDGWHLWTLKNKCIAADRSKWIWRPTTFISVSAGTPWHLLQHVQSFFILTPPVFCKSYHALMMSGCITVSLMKALLSVQLQNRRLHCNLITFGGSFNPSFSEWFSAILRKGSTPHVEKTSQLQRRVSALKLPKLRQWAPVPCS